MTIYNEIFDFITSLPGRRARIVPSDYGWSIDGMTPSPELSRALRSLIRARVPDGTQVAGMWLWTPVYNHTDKFLKFTYLDHLDNARTLLVNSGTFSHRIGEST